MSISFLSTTEIEQAEALIKQLLADDFPNLDLIEGSVLRELVINPAAIAQAYADYLLNRLRQSCSLYDISNTPTLATDAILTRVLSNYNVIKDEGATASGVVTIVASTNDTTTVTSGTIFETTGNLQFSTENSYIGVPTAADVTSSYHRLMTERSDGTYSFTINVTAAAAGSGYNISKNTSLTPTSSPINFVRSYAESDFSGGSDAETVSDLVDRLHDGVASLNLGSRASISALLKYRLSSVRSLSIVGCGNAEMTRDQHNIHQFSFGGKTDIYVQTQDRPVQTTVSKTATLVNAGTGEWQISMLRDDAPGYYVVLSVLPAGSSSSGTKEILSDTRGLDLTGSTYVPDINTIIQGAYSRYQTSVIRFKDLETASGKSVGDSATYGVTVYGMPNISLLQTYVNEYLIRNPNGDYLIRAPIPYLVSISMVIKKPAGDEDPDTDSMKTAVAEAVNSLGFVGELYASTIVAACEDYLESCTVQTPIEIVGYLYKPNGDVSVTRETNKMTVPDDLDHCVSSNTVLFMLDPEDVTISVLERDETEL